MKLRVSNVLITGGSSGIGLAIAKRLAEGGAREKSGLPALCAGTLNQKNKNERRRKPQRDRTAPTKWEDKT